MNLFQRSIRIKIFLLLLYVVGKKIKILEDGKNSIMEKYIPVKDEYDRNNNLLIQCSSFGVSKQKNFFSNLGAFSSSSSFK